MPEERPLYLPVILGTTRKGRMSAHAARFVLGQLSRRQGVETELIDIARVPFPIDDAGEEAGDPGYRERIERADGLVLVVPEYNHSFPGLLKHVLDTCLAEYIHKPAGVVGVSAGPFGGTRVVQSLLPALREVGLLATFTDVNFGKVYDVFDETSGALLDEAWVRRTSDFLDELVWMAKAMRHAREQIPAEGEGEEEAAAEALEPMVCPRCGEAMNQHASKLVSPTSSLEASQADPELGGWILEAHTCPACGAGASRPSR
jgi:NAD(P)H-dependent FMN reductase/ribosomal protein S27AE